MATLKGGNAPAVEIVYTRSGWVGWRIGLPNQGGYYARIPDLHEQGNGRTVDEALEDLARQLGEYVIDWDAEADAYESAGTGLDRVNQHSEPPLVTWARARLREGALAATLHQVAGKPVLDLADEQELIDTPR